MMNPNVLLIDGKIKRTKNPTKKVQINKYIRYECGASSGSRVAPKVSNPNQFIIPLE